jgi:hypothetical protein
MNRCPADAKFFFSFYFIYLLATRKIQSISLSGDITVIWFLASLKARIVLVVWCLRVVVAALKAYWDVLPV